MASIASADMGSGIKSINNESNVLNRCMDEIEKHYRAQFTTIDTVLGKLRNTSDYLSGWLSGLKPVCGEK